MIAPIPGKAAIGIEIPNREPSVVYFKSLVRSETFIQFDARLPIGVGKTISGEVYCTDLTKMPHLLIAGSTGSGKSVGINTIIGSLLYRVPPSDLKFVMIDPKKLELSIYAKLKEHYLAVCPDLDEIVITHPQNAIMILRSVVNEMEARYDKLAALGVREITHYNRKIEEYQKNGESSEEYRHLPYLVIVVDELADLILSATREVEEPITRLAQMARAVGIHLIMATQRPSVDILTGLIKANFPARVAYQVATRPDSKVILDMYGAEKLIGNGDMLFLPPGKVKPLRLQNPLITTEEVERIIKHIRKQPKFPPYELKLIKSREKGPGTVKIFERDELFEKAKDTVIRYQQGSVSLLQRKLKIGYARAARIIDELEEAGIVGPPMQEGKAREVLVSSYSPD
jgi:S-DNA-T family DNA segregation ATPase FtsK/SpoIIIE